MSTAEPTVRVKALAGRRVWSGLETRGGGVLRQALYNAVQQRTVRAMARTMTVSEARAALPEVLDRVLAGEEVTLTRHGEPVAVVVRPDRLRMRRAEGALAEAARVGDVLAKGRQARLGRRPSVDDDRAKALIAEVRASRSTR